MRRSLLIVTFIFLFCGSLFAQIFHFGVPNLEDYDMERFHYGFSLGIDIADINMKTKTNYTNLISSSENELIEIYSQPVPAFHVGIVTNMRMGNYFDLRFVPSFSIAHDINLYYRFAQEILDPNPRKSNFTNLILRKIECHYINFPLFIKFKSSRMHNVRMYAFGGGQVSLNMMSTKNNKISTLYNDEMKADVIPIIKPYDIQVKGGIGFDFYTTYFKFSTEFKVSFGVINLLETERNIKDKEHIEYYKSSSIITGLQSLKSKTFTISFIFE
ncbi:MAG: PorT family protein [Bacteroidetes bacterium]|nr:PorT family protein [Bacteroidota bacterium]MCL1969714.1 PorT family protein [Bacteroidota bacterium]